MNVQELLKQPRRYGALLDRLPGISTSASVCVGFEIFSAWLSNPGG